MNLQNWPQRTASHGDNLMQRGILLRDLKMPDLRNYAVEVPKPGVMIAEATRVMGRFLRDIIKLNLGVAISGWWVPETASNRLGDVFDVTNRTWVGETLSYDDHLAADGRVMEILSIHLRGAGWKAICSQDVMASSPEAFIHIVDSMFSTR